MPAAIAIPAIIGAASSVGGAAIAAHSAGKAAKMQQQGAREALDLNRQIYQDQRATMAPWVQAGQSAATTLGRLLQPGQAYTPHMQAFDALDRPGAGYGAAAARMPGQVIQLQAPDGSIAAVPARLAQQFIQRGARPVTGGAGAPGMLTPRSYADRGGVTGYGGGNGAFAGAMGL